MGYRDGIILFGRFSYIDKEFIISNPQTPTPWMNYLSNKEYCVLLSNTAGGFSFHIDPKDKRITRYRYNSIPMDRPGKYIYVKNVDTGEIWSPTWQPVQRTLDQYKCHIGFGYNKVESDFNNIKSTITYLVPSDDNIEIWDLSIQNLSKEKKTISLFTYVEFALWNAIHDQWDLQYVQNIAVSKFENNSIFYSLFDFSPKVYAFFTCSEKITNYDCDRESFIGPYRSESNPIAVEKGDCSNSEALGGNPIAATHIKLELESNQKKNIVFILGIVKSKFDGLELEKKYHNSEIIDRERQKVKTEWLNKFSAFETKTQEEDFDNLVNGFNAYQCHITFNWSRYVSFYETGIGRGMGFRDSCQDILGVCHSIPVHVRSRIIELLENQFQDGHVYHQFFPLTKTGGFPDYTKEGMEFFSDDHLWPILSVTHYLKETGDFSLLEEKIPYVDGEPDSIYNHLKKSINFSFNNLGKHDIPLMASADWNDALQLPGKESESAWSAMLLHKSLLDMKELALKLKKESDENYFYQLANKLKKSINENCWDGTCYIRGYTAKGAVVGSKQSNEGTFYLNPQTWSVIANIATVERSKGLLQNVKERLATKYGAKLLEKPYTRYYPDLGGISTFPPGLKENGAIFCHTNPWLVIAECMLGNGDQAFEYLKSFSPLSKVLIQQIHRAEPYIYSQMITGPEHPKFGQAKNSWLTGTASWSYYAMTNWILGMRPEYDGLRIDPCIPKSWGQIKIKRIFRGTIYQVSILNKDHISHGIKEILIDNEKVNSNVIPVFTDKKIHIIEIRMG